jgi:outer membrane receptor protein involved in Fe transport
VGNPDLGPERTRELEVGFDAGFLQGRGGLEATYYNTLTSDALVGVTLPPSNGILATRTQNAGELKSEGWEFQVTGTLVRTPWLEWKARGNLAFMSSEALDLNCREDDQGNEVCELISSGLKSEIRKGFAVPTNFGYRVTNANEFADPIVSDTLEAIGPVYPTRLLGFGTNVKVGNRLTLDALVEHQGGHYLPNYTGYQNARRGVWYPCYDVQRKMAAVYDGSDASALDDVTALERARCATNALGGHNSDFWVEKADFWKLRTIALTYDVPERFLPGRADRATITLAGRNLYTWTDYTGLDPEVEDVNDRLGQVSEGAGEYGRREYYSLPPARTFLLTFRVVF